LEGANNGVLIVLTFRHATVADASAIGQLIEAMDVHYRGAGNTHGADAAAAMVADAMSRNEGSRFLLALDDDEPAGVACFGILRPGRLLSGVLFLKDLYVLPSERRAGIGRALMKELAKWAIAQNIGRIDLTTDKTNVAAQRFYESLHGARQDKVMYRFEDDTLARLACAP
jgi:GNAT superfamily N-acetyltransferase